MACGDKSFFNDLRLFFSTSTSVILQIFRVDLSARGVAGPEKPVRVSEGEEFTLPCVGLAVKVEWPVATLLKCIM